MKRGGGGGMRPSASGSSFARQTQQLPLSETFYPIHVLCEITVEA